MKTKQLALAGVIGLSGFAIHCSSSNADCNETRTCAVSPDGDAGGDGSSGGTDSGPAIPPGCDPNADAKDAPKCVVNEFGVFVDAAKGNDGNSGTKELPVKSIGGALAKLGNKTRVYVCEGTYAESVKLTSAVSIYGGFGCADWSYSGALPKIAPGAAGKEALVIENVKSSIVIADVHAEAAPGDATNKNSIASRIVGSTDVKLVRVKATAGAGFDGAKGADGTTGTLVSVSSGEMNLNGNPASGTTAGAAKTCTCSSGGTSTGGAGGAAGGDGAGGVPKLSGVAPKDGAGGTGGVSCNPDGFGHNGADAPNGADAAKLASVGAMTDAGWAPASGEAGTNGGPGQGGGGGGGRDGTSAGGGGGCGGCGGLGGKGGQGGGASIAVLAHESPATLVSCTLASQDGGAGGKGGGPGASATGGSGANGGASGCQAGEGGKGGQGGAGAGGAGGISVGILYKGTKPNVDAATEAAITVGKAGGKGIGGAPDMNDGPPGIAEKIHAM